MDSTRWEGANTLDAIKESIVQGWLTPDEMKKRLREAIEVQEAKPEGESDTDLIVMCSRVLYELETGEVYKANEGDQLLKLHEKLSAVEKSATVLRPVKRATVMLAAMIALLIGIELFLPHGWLYGIPSVDEQQYVIQGVELNSGTIAEGKANAQNSYKEIRTVNFSDAISVLGYTPSTPSYQPDGWHVQSYYVRVTDKMTRFSVSYESNDTAYLLKYEERGYQEPERARIELEQNGMGSVMNIAGKEVYLLVNTNDPACVWLKDLTYFTIYGPVSVEEQIKMIESI